MSKRPAQNGEHGELEANGEPPAQKIKVDPAQDGQDKPSDEVRQIMPLQLIPELRDETSFTRG